MDAKEYLGQIKKIDAIIENKLMNLEELRNRATNISVPLNTSGVKNSKNTYKMESMVDTYIEAEKRTVEQILELNKQKESIIRLIEQLPCKEYDVLYKHYVQGFSIPELVDEMGYSYNGIMLIRKRALEIIQKILDEQSNL